MAGCLQTMLAGCHSEIEPSPRTTGIEMEVAEGGSGTTQMSYTRTWQFLDSRDDSVIVVTVREILEAESGYGLYTWLCAVALSQYLIYRKTELKGKRIVELGSGTALAGFVACRCNALSVTLTDHAEKKKVLQNCQEMVQSHNYHNAQVFGLTWGHFSPQLVSLRDKVDIVIAADCFYNTKDFEPVLITVAYILETNEGAEFWCTYQVRSADRSFDYLLEKWKLKCDFVPLSQFTEDIEAVCQDGKMNVADVKLMVISAL